MTQIELIDTDFGIILFENKVIHITRTIRDLFIFMN